MLEKINITFLKNRDSEPSESTWTVRMDMDPDGYKMPLGNGKIVYHSDMDVLFKVHTDPGNDTACVHMTDRETVETARMERQVDSIAGEILKGLDLSVSS